jgi:hypothetical protein
MQFARNSTWFIEAKEIVYGKFTGAFVTVTYVIHPKRGRFPCIKIQGSPEVVTYLHKRDVSSCFTKSASSTKIISYPPLPLLIHQTANMSDKVFIK